MYEKEREDFFHLYVVGDIKSNPIHIFSSAHKDIECSLLFCAPSHPMSLSTEVDFFCAAVERKIGKKKLRKLTHQYIKRGWWICLCWWDSHTIKINPHIYKTTLTFNPYALLDDFEFPSREKSFSLSFNLLVCVVYENAFHLFRIVEQGKISYNEWQFVRRGKWITECVWHNLKWLSNM